MKKIFGLVYLLFILISSCYGVESIALQGKWRFALDPFDKGLLEKWYAKELNDTILLPGSLQERGYGFNIGDATKWTGSVVDSSWYKSPDYKVYHQEGNIKVPFWLNPDKHYVGVAWYQKEVEIPESWQGYPVEIMLERTHWETVLFIDGKEIVKHESLATPLRYVISDITSGKHIFTFRVDNRVNINVGKNAHSVSDHTQTNWNGIIGDMRLQVKPSVYIDDVQLYPHVFNKSVTARISLKGKPNTSRALLKLSVEKVNGEKIGRTYDVNINNNFNQEVTLELGNEAELWSEYRPNLYVIRVRLINGNRKDEKLCTFGLREFKAKETHFEINGHPIFLRGTLECCIFPKTGYPSMERSYWLKIFNQCKAHGLNHMRFHSWCPPEVAFNVADSLGFYLQVECGGWTEVGSGQKQDCWFKDESDRILKEYGNHPSFCMMAYGNEPSGSKQSEYLSDLIDYWKSKDSRRVYTSAGGWPYISNADYWNPMDPRIQRWAEGINSIINSKSPNTNYNFESQLRKDMPTVGHEVGQWCVFPNFKEMKKYTGVLKAKNFEIFQDILKKNNMIDLADDFLYASGRLQTLCYKADIEAALRTPGFAGFQLLDLHDFPGQGSALVGVLDAFWDEKGYVSPQEYRMFCNQTVPLVKFPKMVWLNDEILEASLEVAHFGIDRLKNANIIWRIWKDRQLLTEQKIVKEIPVGNCIELGKIKYDLSDLKKPSQLTVSVEIEGYNENKWNIWVYPKEPVEVSAMPYITSQLDDVALEHLKRGENVLLLLKKGTILPEKGGDIIVGFSTIFWNTAWTNKQPPHTMGIFCNPKHPSLSAFPTEKFTDYQWWDLLSNCNAMIMNDFPSDFSPIVYLIDDWFTSRKLGLLFECKVYNGKLMVCSADLESNLDERLSAKQFRQSLLEYMSSDRFTPTFTIAPEVIRKLYVK